MKAAPGGCERALSVRQYINSVLFCQWCAHRLWNLEQGGLFDGLSTSDDDGP